MHLVTFCTWINKKEKHMYKNINNYHSQFNLYHLELRISVENYKFTTLYSMNHNYLYLLIIMINL